MAKIDSFRAQLAGGGARANQFRVILTIPGNLGGPDQTNALGKIQFMARAAQLPGSVIPVTEVAFRGRNTKLSSGDRTFEPWTITCYNDNDFVIRNAMESWMANIANHRGSEGLLTSALYQTTLTVQQLDRNDAILKQYQFVNAFPTNVAPIQLSFDQTTAIEEFDITFDYDYWTTAVTEAAEI